MDFANYKEPANVEAQNSPRKVNVCEYVELVREETFEEGRMVAGRWVETIIKGEIWTQAIQKAIDENEYVYIPPLKQPLYLDGPLIIPSDRTLDVSEKTMIKLLPHANTCMIQNEKIYAGHSEVFDYTKNPDKNIHITGGIWSACNNGQDAGNGNYLGNIRYESVCNSGLGLIVFSNIQNFSIRNAVFTECTAFAVQISACSDFLIENIHFDVIYRDGIHMNGPARDGVIRNISGICGDDIVAYNAWDWHTSALTTCPIENVHTDGVFMTPGHMWSEIRILAGDMFVNDSFSYSCYVDNCSFTRIKGIHTVKMYDQANASAGGKCFSPPGKIGKILFQDIEADYISSQDYYAEKHAVFEVCANCELLEFDQITVNFPLRDETMGDWRLVAVGPGDATIKYQGEWLEVLCPDSTCVVEELNFSNIYHKNPAGEYALCTDARLLAAEKSLALNPDYPTTFPRGGTGYGTILKVVI